MRLLIQREDDPAYAHNFGQLWVDGRYFGETLEDKDRRLESGGEKIHGNSAIPRGLYPVTITWSKRFQRNMLLVNAVPGFDSVRIHGGNTEANTEGCPLLGTVRTADGIANCHAINDRLFDLVALALARGEEVTLEVA